MRDPWTQERFRCRLDWGRRGASAAAERGDILVVVDTLSFSTAAVTGVHHGGLIYPCAWDDNPEQRAQDLGAVAAVSRQYVPQQGQFSLSPPTFSGIEPGTHVVLASPNGATCSRFGREVPVLLVGTLVNAQAVGSALASLLSESDRSVTVLAAGERWRTPNDEGVLRFAIEDYLGAGAILSSVPSGFDRSPEATICERAFQASESQLADLLWESGSGRELREHGYPQDVEHASRLNVYDTVPRMQDDWLIPFR